MANSIRTKGYVDAFWCPDCDTLHCEASKEFKSTLEFGESGAQCNEKTQEWRLGRWIKWTDPITDVYFAKLAAPGCNKRWKVEITVPPSNDRDMDPPLEITYEETQFKKDGQEGNLAQLVHESNCFMRNFLSSCKTEKVGKTLFSREARMRREESIRKKPRMFNLSRPVAHQAARQQETSKKRKHS